MRKDFFKRYSLVLLLSFIVVIMVGIKIAYMGVEWEEERAPIVEEVIEEEETVEEKSIEERYPLWEELPYYGEGFTIEKYQDELTLLVENENEVVEETIEMIKMWFEEKGVASDSHRLIIESK